MRQAGTTRAKAVPLAIPGLEPDAVIWRRIDRRTWKYQRGRAEDCVIRGPLPLGIRAGYKSGRRHLRPMVWSWTALLKGLDIRGGGGDARSLRRAKAAAESTLRRARDEEQRWQTHLADRRRGRA